MSYTLSDAPWAVILAAGKGTRLAEATGGVAKQFLELNGKPLFWRSFETFRHVARLGGVVFVFPPSSFEENNALVAELALEQPGLAYLCVQGGERRQDSVRHGLEAVPHTARFVLVHDAARPFFTPALANRILDRLEAGACAVVPGIAVTDTIKRVQEGKVVETPPRADLVAVQTPQGFDRALLVDIHRAWVEEGDRLVTDDAALMEAFGKEVCIEEGELANMKITNPDDLAKLAPQGEQVAIPCTGFGYDVHRYGGERELMLGGVRIEGTDIKVAAHSDGDVLLHAVMDAMLGLTTKGDIGTLFPDKDPAYDGISSAILLSHVKTVLLQEGIELTHVDCTVVAQRPKVSPQRIVIRKNIARLLGLAQEAVSVKATTEEKLGFTGNLEGIKAYAVVTGIRHQGHAQ